MNVEHEAVKIKHRAPPGVTRVAGGKTDGESAGDARGGDNHGILRSHHDAAPVAQLQRALNWRAGGGVGEADSPGGSGVVVQRRRANVGSSGVGGEREEVRTVAVARCRRTAAQQRAAATPHSGHPKGALLFRGGGGSGGGGDGGKGRRRSSCQQDEAEESDHGAVLHARATNCAPRQQWWRRETRMERQKEADRFGLTYQRTAVGMPRGCALGVHVGVMRAHLTTMRPGARSLRARARCGSRAACVAHRAVGRGARCRGPS